MAFVEIDNVTRRYDRGVRALDRVGLAIQQGEWLAVMGPSGSGKTTLLNLLGGLDRADEGRVVVDGLDLQRVSRPDLIRYRRECVGLVFQQFHLIPYLSALENVMLAQYLHSMVDEALDAENERAVLDLFEQMHDAGQTIVMVTHDLVVGRRASRQIQLEHGRVAGEFLTLQQDEEAIDEVLEYLWLKGEGDAAAHEICAIGARLRLAETLFSETFQMHESVVEEEACFFEHILSPVMTDSICGFLNHPPACPHGKPIPRGECCAAGRGATG